MGSRFSCLKPTCLLGNNTKKEPERRQQKRPLHKDDKKERVLKKDKLTLQDYILSSPRSSSLIGTSNKRVHPNPVFVPNVTSKGSRLGGRLDTRIEDGDDKLKMKSEASLLSKGERTKKKVSFRMPEVADVFILADSPITAHESTALQVDHDHHSSHAPFSQI